MEDTIRSKSAEEREIGGFLGALVRAQSYKNILYNLISFPLGIFYFVFLAAGLSVGLGLSIILIGIPILLLVLVIVRGLTAWERFLAEELLDAGLAPAAGRKTDWRHPLGALKVVLTDSGTWKGILFLFVKFPLGIFSFVSAAVLIAVPLSLILVPFIWQRVPVTFFFGEVSSAEEALLCLILGVGIGLLSIHAMNFIAAVWRALARLLLGGGASRAASPPPAGPIVIP